MKERRHWPFLLVSVNTCNDFGTSVDESQFKGHAQKIDDLPCGQLVPKSCEFSVGKSINVHSGDFRGLPAIACLLSTSFIKHQPKVDL